MSAIAAVRKPRTTINCPGVNIVRTLTSGRVSPAVNQIPRIPRSPNHVFPRCTRANPFLGLSPLGLALARQIVGLHGGRISVQRPSGPSAKGLGRSVTRPVGSGPPRP
jgi:hypothetical protein